LQAQIIRFPIERCRPRSSVDIAAFMLAPTFFCLTLATMVMTPRYLWEELSKHQDKADDGTISKRLTPGVGLVQPRPAT
jgi:hypothetical protein